MKPTTPKQTAPVASTLPYPMAVKKGQTYLFCACGHSATEPYCDRACAALPRQNVTPKEIKGEDQHDTATEPADAIQPEQPDQPDQAITYVAARDQIVFFCGCKQSAKLPICDGRHTTLTNRTRR